MITNFTEINEILSDKEKIGIFILFICILIKIACTIKYEYVKQFPTQYYFK